PQYVRLGNQVSGVTNQVGGRDRVFRPSVETEPGDGNVGLFVFGENRLRVEKGRGSAALKLFSARSLHYLDAGQTVPAGSGVVEPARAAGQFQGGFYRDSLPLDCKGGASDAEISRVLQALRLKPASYCGRYRIVEGRTLPSHSPEQVEGLRTQIGGYHDELI